MKDEIEKLLLTDVPFAIFQLPGESGWHRSGREGFEVLVNNYNRPLTCAKPVSSYNDGITSESFPQTTSKEQYTKAVDYIRNKFHGDENLKTVLSRVVTGVTKVKEIAKGAQTFFAENPGTFRLLLQTYNGHIWLMATPEVLLEMQPYGTFRTMALAGTRPVTKKETPWDAKNLSEQKIVSDYIRSILENRDATFTAAGPKTKISGAIEHICTEFIGQIDTDLSLIDLLSPTPAVAGFPKEESIELISRLEDYRRTFYSGYTLVKNQEGTTTAYVNLRCACVEKNTGRYAVFAGGGITASSQPEAEYAETSLKAGKLIEVLE